MKKFGKIVLWCILAAVAAGVIFAAAAGIKYYRVTHSDAKAELVSGPECGSEKQAVLGVKYRFKTVFRVPWGMLPATLTATPSPGSQLTAEPDFKLLKRAWGSNLWEGVIELQCFRDGEIKAASAQASFSNRQTIELKLPSLQVKGPQLKGDQLELAGEAEIAKPAAGKRRFLLWVFLGLLILAAVILIVLKFMKRGHTRQIPPWEKALNAIKSLLEQIRAGSADPEKSIARLTDIVREYMEKRFQLRAEHQTTAEFMADLERGKGGLSGAHRNFLKDFLNAADLVKFARMAADRKLFEDAAEKAGELIRATAPDETGKDGKK